MKSSPEASRSSKQDQTGGKSSLEDVRSESKSSMGKNQTWKRVKSGMKSSSEANQFSEQDKSGSNPSLQDGRSESKSSLDENQTRNQVK